MPGDWCGPAHHAAMEVVLAFAGAAAAAAAAHRRSRGDARPPGIDARLAKLLLLLMLLLGMGMRVRVRSGKRVAQGGWEGWAGGMARPKHGVPGGRGVVRGRSPPGGPEHSKQEAHAHEHHAKAHGLIRKRVHQLVEHVSHHLGRDAKRAATYAPGPQDDVIGQGVAISKQMSTA
jgi:hypothetical protein